MFWRKAPVGAKPEWIIVGLGNPGIEYAGTRHNVGFEVIDLLAEKLRIKMDRGKHRARVGSGLVGQTPVLLVKPLTYMNLSGQSVAPLAREHGVPVDHVLVVADDLDLKTGRVRLKPKGSAGGHNGHKSLIASLRSDEYPRIKIGVGRVHRSETIDHVLSPFEQDEQLVIKAAKALAVEGCIAVVEQGLERAMSVVNLPNSGEDSS